MDRRRHHRYAAHGRAEVMVLRDVDIETLSPAALVVLTDAPIATGTDATVRVTGANHAHVTLRVRAMNCHHVIVDDRRRFRVIYAVLGPEECASV